MKVSKKIFTQCLNFEHSDRALRSNESCVSGVTLLNLESAAFYSDKRYTLHTVRFIHRHVHTRLSYTELSDRTLVKQMIESGLRGMANDPRSFKAHSVARRPGHDWRVFHCT